MGTACDSLPTWNVEDKRRQLALKQCEALIEEAAAKFWQEDQCGGRAEGANALCWLSASR